MYGYWLDQRYVVWAFQVFVLLSLDHSMFNHLGEGAHHIKQLTFVSYLDPIRHKFHDVFCIFNMPILYQTFIKFSYLII